MRHKFELSEAELGQAVAEYVQAKTGIKGKTHVHIHTQPDTDRMDRFTGTYTCTATVTVEPST